MTKIDTPRGRCLLVLGAAAVLAAGLIGGARVGTGSGNAPPRTAAPGPAAAAAGAARSGTAPGTAAPPTAAPRPAAAVTAKTRAFPGIPQQGAALGRPTAPVTLVEYADLQCPYCAEWARRTLPVLASDYVRSGRLRIVFRGLAFVGPESD